MYKIYKIAISLHLKYQRFLIIHSLKKNELIIELVLKTRKKYEHWMKIFLSAIPYYNKDFHHL